jgi:hypothetical protein
LRNSVTLAWSCTEVVVVAIRYLLGSPVQNAVVADFRLKFAYCQ